MKRSALIALSFTTLLLTTSVQAELIKLEFEGFVTTSYDYTGHLAGPVGHNAVNGHSILVQVAWDTETGTTTNGYDYNGPYSWLTTRVLMDGKLLTHDVSEVDMTGWPHGTIDRNNTFVYSDPVDYLMLSSGFEPVCEDYVDPFTGEPDGFCYGPSSYISLTEYEVVSAYQWDTNNTPEHGEYGYDDIFGPYGPELWVSGDFFQTKTFQMEASSNGWNFADSNDLDANFDFSGDFYWLGSLSMAYSRSECGDWEVTLGCRRNDVIVPEYQNFEMTFYGSSARVGWSTDPVASVDEGQWGPLALFAALGLTLRLRRRSIASR